MLRLISLRNVAYLIGNQYISVAKQRNLENLSMNKDRHIISELNSFFAESRRERQCSANVLPSNPLGKVADKSALAFSFKQSSQNLR